MKRILCTAATALLPVISMADVYVITDDAGGMPRFKTLESPALTEVPKIGAVANKGFSYAQLWSGMHGYNVFEGRIAPGGSIASHDGPETYIAYIVSGRATMGNDAPNGSMDSSFDFGPGDVIAFGPGTMHHWVNGDEELVFVGFQRLPNIGEN